MLTHDTGLPKLTGENSELVMIALLVARDRALALDAIETAMYANTMDAVMAHMETQGGVSLETPDTD